ncbi:MAG: mechanosensitive ion channel family protein [Ilumatobacteraceae bacterium]
MLTRLLVALAALMIVGAVGTVPGIGSADEASALVPTAPAGTGTDDTEPDRTTTTTTTTTPSRADQEPDDETDDEPSTGFPSGPPPGFTDDQYRRFVNVVQACGFDSGWVCDSVYSLTGSATAAEATQWVYDIPLRLALVLLVAFGAHRLVRRGIRDYASRVSVRSAAERQVDPDTIKRDELRVNTVTAAIGGAASVVIFVIAGLIALGELGITLGPLLAGAGIAGIALGFGAQNLVRDLLAGVFVVFEDHYGVGDIIDAGKATGIVEDVSLRITKVRDIHGTLWFVPNGIIEGVGNHSQLWARAIIDFDVDYHADHERAGEIIKETADAVWRDPHAPVRIIEEPALWGVESLGDSSVVIRLAVKCAPAEQWKLSRLLRGEVKKALGAEGIEIPFPQHTVWIHGVPPGDEQAGGTTAGPTADG